MAALLFSPDNRITVSPPWSGLLEYYIFILGLKGILLYTI